MLEGDGRNSPKRELWKIEGDAKENGAQGGTRTRKELPPRDFKSLVYTIPPPGQTFLLAGHHPLSSTNAQR